METNMSAIKIAPSILSADFMHLADDVRCVLEGGAEYIHVDIMDGEFVPNISIGIPVVKSMRREFPDAFLDVHLMIDRPVRYVKEFAAAGASLLTFHVEADTADNITAAIALAKQCGVKVGLSVKPGTDVSALYPWLDELDLALVMTVEPGFGGQKFMHDQMEKVRTLRALIDEKGLACELEVDGGIAADTAPIAVQAGARVLVAGSAVFGKADPVAAMRAIRGGQG